MPSLVPLIGGRNLVLKAKGQAKAETVRAIQSLVLRLLATVPPGRLRFLFLDPVGLGQNVAAFMHLADYDPALVTHQAWTEPQHIEAQLAALSAHMETVIQKFLRDTYPTMEDYNAKAGEVAEPYRVLTALNFPAGFNETSARRLVSIATNGPRCGVYSLITVDTEQPLPHGFQLADLERTATVIAWDGHRFVWQDDDFKDCLLELDKPPDLALPDPPDKTLFGRIITTVGKAARDGKTVQVPFARMLELLRDQVQRDAGHFPGVPATLKADDASTWWQGDTAQEIVAPLGRAGAKAAQCLHLGTDTAIHALVVGRTGSGKSTLLHTLITGLAQLYSPAELQLYLVDFKQGVEFKTYATNPHRLPHARVVAIESEREFGLSVLEGLEAKHKDRSELFKAATGRLGRRIENLVHYREEIKKPLPRILLIVDEFQVFFMEDDALASQAGRILDFLVRQGRSSGIHVLLGSQTLAGAYSLARSTIDQMGVRIALQCSEADSRLILADDNPAARLLSRPGEAIYNAANGLLEGNSLFQVAWLPEAERTGYLAQVSAKAHQEGFDTATSQIVFEGYAPARVERNRPLQQLLRGEAEPADPRRVAVWLGEPVAIKEPTAAFLRRQSGSHLLVVGPDEAAAAGLLAVALVSLAAQAAPEPPFQDGQGPRLHLFDFTPADSPQAGTSQTLAEALSPFVLRHRRRDLPEVLGALSAEVARRVAADGTGAAPLYLVLHGVQRARDLRQDDEVSFSYSDEAAAHSLPKQLAAILQDGPEVGVHTLVWCDTYTNLSRVLDRRSLREFDLRVVFQMGAEDSSNLIDTPAASKLGANRALFFSVEEGTLEKFRPYQVPPAEWLERLRERLRTA